MSKEARAAAAAYAREWRRKNPDKCRETRARYWEKKARLASNQKGNTKDGARNAAAV